MEGALTLFLKEVPWDQALDVVLKNQGMGRHLSGNVLRIAKLSTLEAEQQQQQRLAQARVAAAEVQTRIRRPSYARAAELSPILKKALSPRGDIIVDERTNALVISDIPPRLKAVETLLRQLDRKVPSGRDRSPGGGCQPEFPAGHRGPVERALRAAGPATAAGGLEPRPRLQPLSVAGCGCRRGGAAAAEPRFENRRSPPAP